MLNRLRKIFASLKAPDKTIPAASRAKSRGNEFLAQGKWEEAAECYRQAIEIDPNFADAYVNLGFVLKEQHFDDDARRYLMQAVAIDPKLSDAFYVLGTLSQGKGDLNGAIEHFKKTIEIKPGFELAYRDLCLVYFQRGQKENAKEIILEGLSVNPEFVDFHYYLGNLHADEKEADKAIACYQKALSIQPDYAEVLSNLGNVFREQRKLEEAVSCYRRALALNPDMPNDHLFLGNIFFDQGKLADAVACYQQVKRLEPENNAIVHLIAALTGDNPESASGQYVERLFDSYASNFDEHLVKVLRYDTPAKLITLIKKSSGPPGEQWDALDLGCGTGLVGSAFSPYTRTLVGVDLSAKMLERARALDLYDRLEQSDLLSMMRDEASSSYDIAIAADVFVYVGKLDEIVTEVKRLLRSGGLFAFSVEALEPLLHENAEDREKKYRLNHTARYAHSSDYIKDLASTNGFRTREIMLTHSRVDKGKPVPAWLVLLEAE